MCVQRLQLPLSVGTQIPPNTRLPHLAQNLGAAPLPIPFLSNGTDTQGWHFAIFVRMLLSVHAQEMVQ